LRPSQEVCLAVQRLPAERLEGRPAPYTRELCQGRWRSAETSLGQEGCCLFPVKLGLRISVHYRFSLSMSLHRVECQSFGSGRGVGNEKVLNADEGRSFTASDSSSLGARGRNIRAGYVE